MQHITAADRSVAFISSVTQADPASAKLRSPIAGQPKAKPLIDLVEMLARESSYFMEPDASAPELGVELGGAAGDIDRVHRRRGRHELHAALCRGMIHHLRPQRRALHVTVAARLPEQEEIVNSGAFSAAAEHGAGLGTQRRPALVALCHMLG